jgi:hypothetical protein
MGKVNERWEESKKLAFVSIQKEVAISMFQWDPALPVYMYTNTSRYAASCLIL